MEEALAERFPELFFPKARAADTLYLVVKGKRRRRQMIYRNA